MKKIGFCFAGQGSQHIGMGYDFYQEDEDIQSLYDSFPEIKELCFNENEKLNQTAYAQKAMLLTSYAIASYLKKHNVTPEYVCGLSLGEYSALAFSDVWKLEDAIQIVSQRGRIMQEALPLGTTKMTAIIGLDRETILNCIQNVDGICEIANYNCPGQIVITGENVAVDQATENCKNRGAKMTIPLNVSGAFHCSLLNDASKKLRMVLDQYEPQKPCYQVVYNVSGKEENKPLNDILEEQICHSVYFEDSIRYMLDAGVDTFVEIGPGKALTGFIKRVDRSLKVYTVTDIASAKACIEGILNEN